MDLQKFLKDIEKELELSILNEGETPILDRLQIHLDNLNEDYNLATMLNPKNLKVELYLSMLYQIVYPAKPNYLRTIMLNGKPIKGKNSRIKMLKVVKYLGVEKIKNLPYNNKNLYKSSIEDPIRFKPLNGSYVFDITFKGVGASQGGENFIKEVNKIYPHIDLSIQTKINYKY